MKWALLLPLALAGCGAAGQYRPEPIVVPKTVLVPVKGDCVPTGLGEPPAYIDSDEALRGAKDAAERYQLTAAGRKQRQARLDELEPVVKGCR
jgi:hypothetical protein